MASLLLSMVPVSEEKARLRGPQKGAIIFGLGWQVLDLSLPADGGPDPRVRLALQLMAAYGLLPQEPQPLARAALPCHDRSESRPQYGVESTLRMAGPREPGRLGGRRGRFALAFCHRRRQPCKACSAYPSDAIPGQVAPQSHLLHILFWLAAVSDHFPSLHHGPSHSPEAFPWIALPLHL
jgi:hypothetical protein